VPSSPLGVAAAPVVAPSARTAPRLGWTVPTAPPTVLDHPSLLAGRRQMIGRIAPAFVSIRPRRQLSATLPLALLPVASEPAVSIGTTLGFTPAPVPRRSPPLRC